MRIHIYHENAEHGPYNRETLLGYLRLGVFSEGTLAWHDGMEAWEPLPKVVGYQPPRQRPATGWRVFRKAAPVARARTSTRLKTRPGALSPQRGS